MTAITVLCLLNRFKYWLVADTILDRVFEKVSLFVLKIRSKQKMTLFLLSLNCHFFPLIGLPMS